MQSTCHKSTVNEPGIIPFVKSIANNNNLLRMKRILVTIPPVTRTVTEIPRLS